MPEGEGQEDGVEGHDGEDGDVAEIEVRDARAHGEGEARFESGGVAAVDGCPQRHGGAGGRCVEQASAVCSRRRAVAGPCPSACSSRRVHGRDRRRGGFDQ
jgi:hypothetical protein